MYDRFTLVLQTKVVGRGPATKLKGQCHEIFDLRFFHEFAGSNFFKISHRYSQLQVHYRCQRPRCRVRPFRLKFFSLISKIKRIWIRFTCVSLFHYKISPLFFRFFSLIFASNFSLRFALVIFASKQNEAKRNSSLFFCFFCFFSLFLLFFAFFCFFCFKFFASLQFSNFRFEAKRGENFFASKEAKFNIFCFILLPNFISGEKKTFLSIFLLNFRLASIFVLNFRLFYLCFRFRFLVFRIEVNHVKSGFFCETKFSLQFQISLPKRK